MADIDAYVRFQCFAASLAAAPGMAASAVAARA
jgi:hypothetical protein